MQATLPQAIDAKVVDYIGPEKSGREKAPDLRAMKRALVSAPLGPMAVLALSSAIIAIESDLSGQPNA
jgi:hypothetical protein